MRIDKVPLRAGNLGSCKFSRAMSHTVARLLENQRTRELGKYRTNRLQKWRIPQKLNLESSVKGGSIHHRQ